MAIQSLTWDELKAVLKAAREERERDWLMMLVGFWHGLRASEVVGLKRENVHDESLTIQRLKGSKKTTQPLVVHEDPLLDEAKALIDWSLKTPGNQKLFRVSRQHFWRLFQKYAEIAGLPEHKRHPHCLKHTMGRQMIHSAGIENTRQYLGHESIASTGEYLEVDDEDAAEAMRRAVVESHV
jgi:integrase/recombinase XerD